LFLALIIRGSLILVLDGSVMSFLAAGGGTMPLIACSRGEPLLASFTPSQAVEPTLVCHRLNQFERSPLLARDLAKLRLFKKVKRLHTMPEQSGEGLPGTLTFFIERVNRQERSIK
jgi:hypothetical protein